MSLWYFSHIEDVVAERLCLSHSYCFIEKAEDVVAEMEELKLRRFKLSIRITCIIQVIVHKSYTFTVLLFLIIQIAFLKLSVVLGLFNILLEDFV